MRFVEKPERDTAQKVRSVGVAATAENNQVDVVCVRIAGNFLWRRAIFHGDCNGQSRRLGLTLPRLEVIQHTLATL